MNELFKTKTFWTGVVGLISAAAGYFTGEIGGAAALQTALGSLAFIFLRDGIISKGKTDETKTAISG